MPIYVPIVMYALRLFIKNYIVTSQFHGRYRSLSVCKISFLNFLWLMRIRQSKLKKKKNKMKNCENELPVLVIFRTPIFLPLSADDRLSEYYHGNANVWE